MYTTTNVKVVMQVKVNDYYSDDTTLGQIKAYALAKVRESLEHSYFIIQEMTVQGIEETEKKS